MDCIRHPKNFEKGMGLCVYKEPVIHSLAAIKYKNQREFAEYYIGEIRKRKGKQLKNLCPDVIVPVPLYPGKRRRRGFNQAELFAKGISEILNCPVEKNLVKRVKETKASKNLNPQERKKNLRHAFEGSKKYYEKIGKPKTALIVDDIYTTGATAEGVAEALKKTGVQKVYVFCIAVGTGNA